MSRRASNAEADPERRLRRAEERLRLRRSFGARVSELRKQAGLTQRELATRASLSQVTLSRTESGSGSEPGLSLILILCQALEVSPDALLAHLPVPRERRL